ncbi:MAG: DUF4157 domain-containing protein [Bacteroidales bacterium]|nr:DUF4157 domain-containing protein [Bacteroidales bacterium]
MQAKEDEEEPMQAKEEEEMMQAKTEEEEEPMQAKEDEEEPVQAKSNDNGGKPKTDLSKLLKKAKGKGKKIPDKIRVQMEKSFGVCFKDVEIHTGNEAFQMTKALNAQAFTSGNDIFFNEGKYNPESSAGKELLAHELTHVVQQNK